MVEADQEGVEEEEVVEEQMTHLWVVVAEEEGRRVRMRNALVAAEDTSCWEEAGALLHQVEMAVEVEVPPWELWKEVVVVPLGPWPGGEEGQCYGEVVVAVVGVLLCTAGAEVELK